MRENFVPAFAHGGAGTVKAAAIPPARLPEVPAPRTRLSRFHPRLTAGPGYPEKKRLVDLLLDCFMTCVAHVPEQFPFWDASPSAIVRNA